MKSSLVALLVASLAAPQGGPGPGGPPSAVVQGERAYQEGRYDEAAAAFERAYAEHADPAFLYAQAQALRKAGDCREATTLYRRFLDTDPPEQAERTARDNMAACAEQLAAQPATDPAPSPEPPPAQPVVDEPREPQATARPWYRDPWGATLVGIGVTGLAIGGGLYGQALTDERAAERAQTDPEYGQNIERAATLSRAGIAMFAVGSAFIVAGTVRWIVLATRGRGTDAGATAWSPSSLNLRF